MLDKAELVFLGARHTASYDCTRLGIDTMEMTDVLGAGTRMILS